MTIKPLQALRALAPLSAALLLSGAATPVRAVAPRAAPEVGELDAVLRHASAKLVEAQTDTPKLKATWSWARDGKLAAPNAGGLIALSLIRVHQATGDAAALRSALRWGEARVADLSAWRQLFDPDIEALAALGALSGRSEFTRAAAAVFERRWGEATPAEALARLRSLRLRSLRKTSQALLGYDAALLIRAAAGAGRIRFASAVVREVVAAPGLWAKSPAAQSGRGWATLSRAALLDALQTLEAARRTGPAQDQAADPGGAAAQRRLATGLLKAQGADGSFAQRNTQATAYALLALGPLQGKTAQAARARARSWLRKTQLKDGSWASFHDGLPEPFVGEVVHEVTAEVLLALAR